MKLNMILENTEYKDYESIYSKIQKTVLAHAEENDLIACKRELISKGLKEYTPNTKKFMDFIYIDDMTTLTRIIESFCKELSHYHDWIPDEVLNPVPGDEFYDTYGKPGVILLREYHNLLKELIEQCYVGFDLINIYNELDDWLRKMF